MHSFNHLRHVSGAFCDQYGDNAMNSEITAFDMCQICENIHLACVSFNIENSQKSQGAKS